jgi:D-glutamate cyclase
VASRSAWADPIDHILALDPGGRGIAAFFTPGAAREAAKVLRAARRVLIVTGFVVEAGAPETDGPPGAAALGRALRTLGASVRYVTDPACVPVLGAALAALGEPAEVVSYPEGAGAAREVLGQARPTHLVAVERPGRSGDGDYLNARGRSIAAWNRPIDELFDRRPRGAGAGGRRPVTVAVGDGGNEVGMGNVRARLVRESRLMARIASVVRADHLVVAGVSNWGAYGVVAHLARLSGRPLLHEPALEPRVIEACVAAGAVDGITRRREPTVDGIDAATHAAIVALLGLSWGPRSRRRGASQA